MRADRLPGMLICLLLLMAVSCGSCSGSTAPVEAQPGLVGSVAGSLSGALPTPISLKAAAASCNCNGSGHINEQCQNVTPTGTAAVFAPDCDPEQPTQAGLAWAIYALGGAAGMESGSLTLEWSNQGDGLEYYVGCGNMSRNAWVWHAAPAGNELAGLPLQTYLNGGGTLLVAVVGLGQGTQASGTLARLELSDGIGNGGTNLFFLHHSTGAGIIGGGMRTCIADYNTAHGTGFVFWDHGYNDAASGLHGADGNGAGCYWIPNDNTDPDGLNYLWASTEPDAVACRNQILAHHDVIAFKSCFPASAIGSAAELQQYKDWYNEMLPLFDSHPEKLFVVMSTPPLHRLATNPGDASRARAFANWLNSGEYLSSHPNVICFDLFDMLAQPDDGSAAANMLRYEFEDNHEGDDSHPNSLANAVVAPLFAQFLIDASLGYGWPE